MTNQPMNHKKNEWSSIPKKWWLAGLCSCAVLGGVFVYGYHSFNYPMHQMTRTTTISSEAPSQSSSLKPWEKQLKEEWKAETKEVRHQETKGEEKTRVIDQILDVLIGGNQEGKQTIFGIQIVADDSEERIQLIRDLAQALNQQEIKEQAREATKKEEEKNKNTLLLASDQQLSRDGLVDLSVPVLIEKKTEEIFPEMPGTEEGTPTFSDVAISPDEPIIPILPEKTVVPIDTTSEPEPAPLVSPEEPDDMLDQLIQTNKLALTTVKNKVEQINQSLHEIQIELAHLEMIEEETSRTAKQATDEWQKVSDLVTEYNRLSQEIKKLVAFDGQVLSINYDLYRETYEQLSQKVIEIKEAQNKANQTTTQMSESVQKAQETANRLPEIKQQYQDLQEQVLTTKHETQSIVSNAQSNEEVSREVQKEINQVTQSEEILDTSNQVVGNQLEESNQTDYQPVLEQVTQTLETVMNEELVQNNAVDDVLTTFEHFPIVEDTSEPLTSETASETLNTSDFTSRESFSEIEEPVSQIEYEEGDLNV
ncbi:hypothetical protein NGG16_16320 [Enterococcus casseliflavus]|uniref:hypothetical protein n=1 Tax=Enterococcus casseliflavus TaxID=37734 RepID=UPI002DBBEBAD|nr:hypothetical protein [Enterococcus casseliflavus]MEB8419001.1 hypothetical protein [Enterococcus casseliflavus]